MNWIRFKEIAKKEKYNTNNAWGFGGGYGIKYTLKIQGIEFEYKKGVLCYRHPPNQKYEKFSVNKTEVTKEQFETKLISLLQ